MCLISLLKMREKLSTTQRDIKKLQMETNTGLFENVEKSLKHNGFQVVFQNSIFLG
jgi:hypothetical protein